MKGAFSVVVPLQFHPYNYISTTQYYNIVRYIIVLMLPAIDGNHTKERCLNVYFNFEKLENKLVTLHNII